VTGSHHIYGFTTIQCVWTCAAIRVREWSPATKYWPRLQAQ
jgi:hypothetical protein